MKTCPSCQASYQSNFTHCPRDGAALSEIGAWQDGTFVRGKYRILGKVGEGGMAVVYKAMHVRFEELRALKVMSEELARDRAFVKRFMHEAVLTRKLQHPSAVRVDDIDEAEDGRPFIVMEFLEGTGLKDVIQMEAPMPAARVCPLIRQIAGALDAAHRMGIVHRDVKPANIVLLPPPAAAAESERAKLLDFGIAKAREGQLDNTTRGTTLTGTGNVIGTPAYMSPEQAKGLRGDLIDGRSDVYSLGIVAYEMLLGALPFKADTSVHWILAHLQTPPRPLWEARPELHIPHAVAGVVMRCLEKDPQNRPPTAGALIGEIEWAEHAAGLGASNSIEVGYYAAPAATGIGTAYSAEDFVPGSPLRITEQTSTRQGAQFPRDPEPRSRVGWMIGVMACLLVAGGLVGWKFWPQLAPPASGRSSAPAGAMDNNQGGNQVGATSAGSTSGSGETETPHTQNSSGGVDVDGASASHESPGTNATSDSGTITNSSTHLSGRPNTTSTARQVVPPNREAKAVSHGAGFAEALLRARDDENQGKFEDALREYEQASVLDPSDVVLKQHIRHLREQVEKEKELIH